MIRWVVHVTLAAAFTQSGCQPTGKAAPDQSETADQEIDGARLIRVGPRMHVAPAFTGTAVWRYPNGKRRTARTFKNGILEGPMVSWYDDGQTKSYSVTYKANKKDGVAIGYYKDGKMKFKIPFTKGIHKNIETWWYENGQKQFEFEWVRGRRIKETAWNDKGVQVARPKPKPNVPRRQPGWRPPSKSGSAPSTNQAPSTAKPTPTKTESAPKKK